MPQRQLTTSSKKTQYINLAVGAIKSDASYTIRAACRDYDAPFSTVHARLHGRALRAEVVANCKKLTEFEEAAIVERILDLDSRGFPPTKPILRAMADKLLAERGQPPVGKNWPDNFIKRKDKLRTCYTRAYDRQRALCEDCSTIEAWFKLYTSIKEKYGILNEDTYNFDETGFIMGVITSQLVITGSERRGKRKAVQPGNREWTTVINSINAMGWSVPPFVIFKGKQHINTWYDDPTGMEDWVIGVSANGWTTNEHGVAWLKHFDAHTKTRTQGAYRLLIIDGHESHNSIDFRDYCKEAKIITILMPPHSSHLLQPLDVGCFSPLKKAYGTEISALAATRVTKVDKPAFLQAYKKAYFKVFQRENIQSSFRGAGLVPFNPQVVLSQLDVKLRTPTPPAPEATPWESRTPNNMHELGAQWALVRKQIEKRHSSSPTERLAQLDSLVKGASMMAHGAVLIRDELSALKKATEAANKQKARKRKYIQNQGTLMIREGSQIAPAEGAGVVGGSEQPAKRVRAEGAQRAARTCGLCGQLGHDRRTCTTEVLYSSDSE